jgi:hypothetical protein
MKPPRIFTNRIIGNKFRPLSAAIRGAFNPNYLEHWTANTPPKVIGQQRIINGHASTEYLASQWVTVLDVTLPFAMPCCVLTACWYLGEEGTEIPRARLPNIDRRPVEIYNSAAVAVPPSYKGAFLVEWGTGLARYYTWIDLAENSINLPMTNSVRVSAQIPRLIGFPAVVPFSSVVNAECTPGHFHPRPRATHSFDIICDGQDHSQVHPANVTGPPHVRDFSAHLFSTSVAASASIDIFQSPIGGFQEIGSYLIEPAIVGNPQTRPYGLNNVPFPGGAGRPTVNVTCPVGERTNFKFSYTIEP